MINKDIYMYTIKFYEDERGFSDVKTVICKLRADTNENKDARINFHKVVAYIDLLEEMETRVGKPVLDHLFYFYIISGRKHKKLLDVK